MDPGNPSGAGPSGVGSGPRPLSAGGPVNQVLRRRILRYQRRPGGPYTLYSPFGRMNRSCECRHSYGYPDEVVLAVDDEQRRLGKANDRLLRQLEEARGVAHGQALRIRELEQGLKDEEERTDAFRRQLHDTHRHLFSMKGQLRERVRELCWTVRSYWMWPQRHRHELSVRSRWMRLTPWALLGIGPLGEAFSVAFVLSFDYLADYFC